VHAAKEGLSPEKSDVRSSRAHVASCLNTCLSDTVAMLPAAALEGVVGSFSSTGTEFALATADGRVKTYDTGSSSYLSRGSMRPTR
jgi:hypothetical protein